jgi:hypothetical protein
MLAISKAAYLNELVHGGKLYGAFPLSEGSLVVLLQAGRINQPVVLSNMAVCKSNVALRILSEMLYLMRCVYVFIVV